MKLWIRSVVLFFVATTLIVRCSESVEEKDVALVNIQGEWFEKVDSSTVCWTFHNHEVRIGAFTHFFQLKDEQLSISGFEHKIKKLTIDSLSLVNQEGSTHTFVRKSKEKVHENV